MDRYLAKLHKKPDHYKKRLALLFSSTVTLFIFGIWSIATFGVNGGIIVAESHEVSPFQSLRMNVATSLNALRGSFQELKAGLEKVDSESKYKEMRNSALDAYGQ